MSDIHIQSHDTGRAAPEKRWSKEEMLAEFEPLGFQAPYIVVKRKSDGVTGSLEFTHEPRWYFDFQPH